MVNLVTEAKKKWTNLKDTYVSKKKMYESKKASGSGAVELPTWKWWPYFLWLSDGTKTFRYT